MRVKPMLWVHIHKAAGTFMCGMARKAQEQVVEPNDNCNWKLHDGYKDSGKNERALSCWERAEYFHAGRFSYAQIEREIWPEDLCWDDFDYGVVLREPLELMHSELNYRYQYYQGSTKASLFLDLRKKLAQEGRFRGGRDQRPQWKFMDNMQTRLLANAMDVPAGQIGQQHLDRAKSLLANFSVVARVEDLSNEAGRRQIFRKLGWHHDRLFRKRDAEKMSNSVKKDLFFFSDQEAEWLRNVNRWDYELYNSVGACQFTLCNMFASVKESFGL